MKNSVYSILQQVSNTSSMKEKESILQANKDNILLQKVIKLTYDSRLNYWLKDFKQEYKVLGTPYIDLDASLDALVTKISTRQITGNEAKEFIYNLYNSLEPVDAEVFKRVVLRDLKCGASTKSFNKIWSNIIYEHPYMRCSSFSDKNLKNISYPCFSQVKMDGLYVDISISNNNEVNCQTRNGQYIDHCLSQETIEILKETTNGIVLQGEALVLDVEGNVLSRKESNGYLNSDFVDPFRVRFYIWDCINYKNWLDGSESTTYKNRLARLESLIENLPTQFKFVDTVICHNKEDIIEHFRQCRLNGEEGTVLKDFTGIWKPTTSKHQIKCKVIFDCDLKLVGYKLGQGKYKNQLGALTCESSDGKLQVSVGGGYKDAERKSILKNIDEWIAKGKIVTIRGNDVTKDKNDGSLWSIFLPRFVEFRNDKSVADSLECVQEQVKSFTNALELIK